MFKRFIHLTTIIILMLAISVSFAWMMDVTAPTGYYPVLRFDEEKQLYIASNDVDINLYVETEDQFIEIASNKKTNDSFFTSSGLGPGSSLKYKLVVKNNTAADLNMSVVLSKISASTDYFYDVMYFGVFSTSGFYAPFEPPKVEEHCMNSESRLVSYVDEDDGKTYKSFSFMDDFKIPGNYSEVEIRFYARISTEATNDSANGKDLQEQSLSIEKINFVII